MSGLNSSQFWAEILEQGYSECGLHPGGQIHIGPLASEWRLWLALCSPLLALCSNLLET